MEPETNDQEKPARGRSILLNLLVLALLFIMVRSILGWSQPKELISYNNFRCNCKFSLPGSWAQRRPAEGGALSDYEIFSFGNAQFFSNKYIRIFHTNMDSPDEQVVGDWAYGLAQALAAEDILTVPGDIVGPNEILAEQISFVVDGWDGRLLYFYVRQDVYAIELAARNFSASEAEFNLILGSFEAVE